MPEQSKTPRKPKTIRNSDQDQQLALLGRLQPQAIELEKAVIGACIIEQDAFATVTDFLKPHSFYESKHQVIFQAIQSLAAANSPIDVLTVTDQLQKSGDLENAGGAAYIAELSRSMLSAAHLEYHARIVAQKALARDLISYTSSIQKLAFDESQDIQELMQMAEGKLFELSKSNAKKDFTQIDPVIGQAYEQLRKAAARTDGMSGIPSGFEKLDAVTAGWQNSDLIIIAARPAMGKTAFVLSMARNMAIDRQIPIAMFSLEMSNVQLVNRMIVNVCELPGEKIKSGQLAPFEWQQLDFKLRELYGKPFYIDDTPSLSVFELRTKARRLVRDYGVQMIIIDYLQLMNASGMSYNSRQEEVSTISRSLKGLAKELNIPIIALSQLNRQLEQRTTTNPDSPDSKRPQLSDLRESGAIEQDADMVCFIHRPEYYKIYKDQYGNDLKGIAEIIIAKHRNGAVGDVRLRFYSEFARFMNLDDDSVPMPTDDGTIKPMPSKMNGDNQLDDSFGSLDASMMPGVAPF
ncbi:MAG: replicative DNA helicase [Bacteroidaceae bacterium]|nr:replicative DNA helicase [Bacteroidaceae bacterium]